MRPLTDKAYIDAQDNAILATVGERLTTLDSKYDTRLTSVEHAIENLRNEMGVKFAELELRVTRALAENQRWVVGAVLAGVTLSTSISAYMQASTLNQLQTAIRQLQPIAATPATAQPPVLNTPQQSTPQSK